MIKLLDYGAGNVRSVRNAIKKLGFSVENVTSPEDILNADKLIFPGVGNFGVVMERLWQSGYGDALIERIKENKPLLGICVALQTLFEGSEEALGVKGLGIIPGMVRRFNDKRYSVPQIGWNGIKLNKTSNLFQGYEQQKLYFVHSYFAEIKKENKEWILATTDYGKEFISAVELGNISAFQFHPEKSGDAGLKLIENFLSGKNNIEISPIEVQQGKTKIAKRIIACLDVRSNDDGDLVVTSMMSARKEQ